jgi:Fatty acid cis/trans isomerase (CTI)
MFKYFAIKPQIILLLSLFILGCITAYSVSEFENRYGPSKPRQRVLNPVEYQLSRKLNDISYYKDVKPILDARCITCHSCYDAPCQLKLSSFEGLDRGATKTPIYDTQRLEPMNPTRLFIDAEDTLGWRNQTFFPVLNEREHSPAAAIDNSVLIKLLQLKRDNPLQVSGRLGDNFEFDIDRTLVCPSIDEITDFEDEHPLWGMPYAMPGLSVKEEATITQWIKEGSKVAPRPPLPSRAIEEIKKWEAFMNGQSNKERLVSRYIYEHLFIGHIHFKGQPDDEFYYLVRSKTPPGQPIKEIKTLRPFEDPGSTDFYYRLRPVVATIVDKNHFVYEFSDKRMQRYRELFLTPDYSISELPGYAIKTAANPFKTFKEIPQISRYKFLLDDAHFFFSGFIKGPVCRGQVAINVIQDHFWVVFIKPDLNFLHSNSTSLTDNVDYFYMPASSGDGIGFFSWMDYDELGDNYLTKKDAFLNRHILQKSKTSLDFIWDGNGSNPNAALTVFRHFDNATVVTGFVGNTPLTSWVVDYPIFERIHYLLVAGFNVFGSMNHQFATRTYMDYIRIDAENNFLRFMPASQRKPIHDSWYQGVGANLKKLFNKPLFSIEHETAISYETNDYKKEFFQQIKHSLGQTATEKNMYTRCLPPQCSPSETAAIQQQVEKYLPLLSELKGTQISALPDVSFLRIKTNNPDNNLIYSLVVNKSLSNLSFVFAESIRRTPENDTLTIVPGFLGSYPNFFFNVDIAQLPAFIESLKQAQTERERYSFYSRFGIRRSNPEIWQHFDWFNQQHKKLDGLNSGIFDLSRYQNL